MFMALVMGRLNSQSDEKLALELRADLPLMRSVGVNTNFDAPSAKTLWKYVNDLGEAIESLVAEFNECLAEAGLVATEGHNVDSTSVKAPMKSNSRDGYSTINGAARRMAGGTTLRSCGRRTSRFGGSGRTAWTPAASRCTRSWFRAAS